MSIISTNCIFPQKTAVFAIHMRAETRGFHSFGVKKTRAGKSEIRLTKSERSSKPEVQKKWIRLAYRDFRISHQTFSPLRFGQRIASRIDGIRTQDLLDSKQLVVFGEPIGPAQRSGLDLSTVGGHSYVGDCGVLRFAGTMTQDGGVTMRTRQFHGIQGFSERADLVHFNENRVGRSGIYSLLEKFDIGDEEIVAHKLDLIAQFLSEYFPMFPIAFSATVFDANDGILAAKLHIKFDELSAGEFFTGAFLESVAPISVVEFGRRHIEREINVLTSFGANPPSSPTAVLKPRFFRTDFSA